MRRRLEDKIEPAIERILEYTESSPSVKFTERSVVVIPKDTHLKLEVPMIVKTELGPQLEISNNGARLWAHKTSFACEQVGIESDDLYVSTGIAQLEMTLAARQALEGDWDLIPRITKTAKVIDKDREISKVAYEISETSRVAVNKIVAGFNQDEMHKVNLLRYGIGVALASMGLKRKDIDTFRQASNSFAVSALDSYFKSSARFLAGHGFEMFDKEHMNDTINDAVSLDPPIIELGSASAMNVTYLFDK